MIRRNVLVFWCVASCVLAGALPAHHAVKRSDDSNPLEAVVSRLTQDLTKLEAEFQVVKTLTAKRAAFRTQLPSAQATIPANAPVRFVEQYDVGGGYDPTTGVYTVPISGVYTFQFQMYPVVVQDLRIDLYGNNHIVVRSGCYDSSATEYTSCASSITVHANAGDKFWLQTTLAGDYFDGYHSFFTGAMISADP